MSKYCQKHLLHAPPILEEECQCCQLEAQLESYKANYNKSDIELEQENFDLKAQLEVRERTSQFHKSNHLAAEKQLKVVLDENSLLKGQLEAEKVEGKTVFIRYESIVQKLEKQLDEKPQALIDINADDINDDLIRSNEKLQAQLEAVRLLLEMAQCPQCNGDGAYYDGMGEVHQCQWCYERKAAIGEKTDG